MIRNATPEDASVLHFLCQEVLGYACSLETIKTQLEKLHKQEEHLLWVFEKEEKVVGFLQAQEYENVYLGSGLLLHTLVVSPLQQKEGIGKAMMQALENFAKSKNLSFVRLHSGEEREKAHLFYASLAYVCEKKQKKFMKYL